MSAFGALRHGAVLPTREFPRRNLPCDEIQDFVSRHIVNMALIGQGKNTL